MSAPDDAVVDGLTEAAGGDLSDVDLDPGLPELNIGDADLAEWVRMTDDIDVACARQVELLEGHPLIPEETAVHGYVYEGESGHLRRPGERVAETVHARGGVAGVPAGDPLVRPAACSARPGRRARRCRGRRQPRRCRRRASDSPRPRRAPGCS